VPDQVAHRREERGGAAQVRAGLDDEVGAKLMDDLLVGPAVERRLRDRPAEPVGPIERPGLIRQDMESRDDAGRAVNEHIAAGTDRDVGDPVHPCRPEDLICRTHQARPQVAEPTEHPPIVARRYWNARRSPAETDEPSGDRIFP